MRHYHGELTRRLVEFGAFGDADAAARGFGYNEYLRQYETGVLDTCRLAIAYAWSRFEAVDADDEAWRKRARNKNSYNKSIPNVVRLMSRCDEIMRSRGV